jgi:hypothetical protein
MHSPLSSYLSVTASKGSLSTQVLTHSLRLLNLLFPNKYDFKGRKLVVVITGCDTGFSYDAYIALAKKGFLV